MNSFARYLGICLAVASAAVAPSSLNAQETSDLNRLYGQGVNAYFAGRSSEAESYLSQAIALEGNNPLFYYFRALSLMRMGRVDEARGDMMVGANIEAQAPQRFAVGRTLERVQGGHRLMLEQYRRRARSQAATVPRQATQLQSPPPQLRRQPQQASYNDEAVIRRRIVIPLDRLLGSGSPQPLSAEELSQRSRQAIGSQVTPPQPTAAATPTSAESEDPFRDDPSRADSAEAAATTPPAVESAGERQPEAEQVSETDATAESGEETSDAGATPEAEATPEDEENPFGLE